MTQQSQPEYEVHLQSDVMVTLRDGVRLATDLYFPARNGKPVEGRWPAVMQRTPYNKEAQRNRAEARYFGSRGYVVIFQDNRGRFKSEGSFVKYLNDPQDGYDTLEWIGNQPWSNGRVGTFGISYGAHPRLHLHGLRRLHQRLRQLLSQQRHPGAAPGLLGLHPRAQQ